MNHEYEIVNGAVHHCTNFIFKPDGSLVPSRINANAVLVHLLKDFDSEGNMIYRRVVTVSCIDRSMKKTLMDEAHRILAVL